MGDCNIICNVLYMVIIIFLSGSPLWEMVQDGIDLKSIKWTQH